MRLTIIKDDNAVIVDGERHMVDCSDLPASFHALQWDGSTGEVEYSPTRCECCGVRSKKGNEFIQDITPYVSYLNAHAIAKQAAEKDKANAAGPQG